MARDNTLFKSQCNRLLDLLAAGQTLGSEAEIAALLDASRTTVRAVLAHLAGVGVLSWDGRQKHAQRPPRPDDYFAEDETRSARMTVEDRFLGWILQGDVPPGTTLNEAQLARQFGLPLGILREFLMRFEPFGLIEKRPNRHWLLKGFTRAFAEEMFDVREMFERRALERLMADADPDLLATLAAELPAHEEIIGGGDALRFPALDARFHALICQGAANRFITDFSRTIAIIVHYHYLWNKKDEISRNREAAAEHLAIIRAVLAKDAVRAQHALDAHLETARLTLLASVRWQEVEDVSASGAKGRLTAPHTVL